MRDELKSRYNNPFPIETAVFELAGDEPLAMEITRALFHSARGYSESFNIYGEDATFEAAQLEREEISRAMSEGQSIRSFGARRR